MTPRFTQIGIAIILAMLFVQGLPLLSRAIGYHWPPVTWTGIEVETPEVAPGGTLRILYHAQVNEVCPAERRGFLIAADKSIPFHFPPIGIQYDGSEDVDADGYADISFALPIPLVGDDGVTPLRPGDYIYRAYSTRFCRSGTIGDIDIPDARFTIVAPPAPAK